MSFCLVLKAVCPGESKSSGDLLMQSHCRCEECIEKDSEHNSIGSELNSSFTQKAVLVKDIIRSFTLFIELLGCQ